MRSIESFKLMPIATIKSHRHKVFQALKQGDPRTYIVKCITLFDNKQFHWICQQIGYRLDVLKQINNSGILQIIHKGIFEVQVKQQDQKSIFFIKRQIRGYSLRKILENERLTISIIMSKDIKELIWSILALIVGGGGHTNLIISLENIIFATQGNTYRPFLNYFSFIGYHLLTFKKNIERKQYLQIAIFLDQQSLETGNIDRFEFKVRNFALLILSIILRKDITADIFQGVDIPAHISLVNARQYLRKYIQPQINSMLKFQYLKKVYQILKIPGLQQLIQSALDSSKNSASQRDWNTMNKLLLNNEDEKQGYFRLPRLLWENQHEWVQKMLNSKGLGIGENGQKIYLAFKISTHLQYLLQHNSWKGMMKKLGYNYRTNQMFYRLLQCASISHSKVLEETAIQLYQLSKQSFVSIGHKENRVIYTSSYERTVLDDMMRYYN